MINEKDRQSGTIALLLQHGAMSCFHKTVKYVEVRLVRETHHLKLASLEKVCKRKIEK